MKKLLIILCTLFIGTSYASTMCVADTAVAVVLDPSIAGTGYTNSAANMTWTTNFPYGDVSGIALCSTTPKTGTGSYPVSDPDESGGGQYCYCKATHPVLSRWVFLSANGSSANCASNCASGCGYNVRYYAGFRSSMFGSVAP